MAEQEGEDLPARYLRQWIHENVFPTRTDKPFPESLKALGLRDPRPAAGEPEGPYQHHVRRLTEENRQLRADLEAAVTRSRDAARLLRAQRDEGTSAKVEALLRERERLRGEVRRALDEVRRLKGKPPRRLAIDQAVRGLSVPLLDDDDAGRALTRVKKLLRHVGVLLGQARDELGMVRDAPQELAQETMATLAEVVELVELRRQDLLRIMEMMRSSPASSAHRGTRSYRPVPPADRGVI